MKALVHHKVKAIALRKKGYTYKEILTEVPVAKSSLSLWLKDLPLTKQEKLALKKRTDSQINHGRTKVAGIMRTRRLTREKEQFKLAEQMFLTYATQPLFHAGISLYWAEGGKRTNQWQFMNSDDAMIAVMIRWLTLFAKINKSDLRFRLYVHKAYKSDDCEGWWSKRVDVHRNQFLKTIIKPSGLGVKKRPRYQGCLRIEVRSSKALLNQMRFWQKMVVEYYLKQ